MINVQLRETTIIITLPAACISAARSALNRSFSTFPERRSRGVMKPRGVLQPLTIPRFISLLCSSVQSSW